MVRGAKSDSLAEIDGWLVARWWLGDVWIFPF